MLRLYLYQRPTSFMPTPEVEPYCVTERLSDGTQLYTLPSMRCVFGLVRGRVPACVCVPACVGVRACPRPHFYPYASGDIIFYKKKPGSNKHKPAS